MEKKTMDCSPEQEEDQKAKDHKDSARHQNNASVINKIQAQKKHCVSLDNRPQLPK